MHTIPEEDGAREATRAHVQEVLRSAESELTGLLRQRDDLANRIGAIKRVLMAITGLVGESILDDDLRILLGKKTARGERGFTSACRKILMQSQRPLSIRSCGDELRTSFPELAGRHKNLPASLRTVLGRLVASGEVRSVKNSYGERTWEWIRKPEDQLLDLPVFDTDMQALGRPAGASFAADSQGVGDAVNVIEP